MDEFDPTQPTGDDFVDEGPTDIASAPKEPQLYDDTVPIMEPEAAWEQLAAADAAKEMVLVKTALNAYTRAMPELTFVAMEKEFRAAGMNTYLIAKEQNVSDTNTLMDLQSRQDCTFTVTLQFSSKPSRPKFAAGWPTSPEENLTRLADAGYVRDRQVKKCRNCDELGHISRECPNERIEREKPEIRCSNCDGTGHYLRDCPEPRGRKDRDVDENGDPRPPREPLICRNCQQEGHKATECTNERVMVCRNCDEPGHASRECPKPRDYSRVQCRNCGEKGHTQVRCKQPPKADDDATLGATGGDGGWGQPDGSADAGWAASGEGAAGGWGAEETAAQEEPSAADSMW